MLKHNQRIRAYMAANMHQVMLDLEWPVSKYCEIKYQYGLAYLCLALEGDVDAIGMVSQQKEFWGWWKLWWYRRENDFLADSEAGGWNLHKRRYQYRQYHNPAVLADERSGAGKEMEESYCRDLVPKMNGSTGSP